MSYPNCNSDNKTNNYIVPGNVLYNNISYDSLQCSSSCLVAHISPSHPFSTFPLLFLVSIQNSAETTPTPDCSDSILTKSHDRTLCLFIMKQSDSGLRHASSGISPAERSCGEQALSVIPCVVWAMQQLWFWKLSSLHGTLVAMLVFCFALIVLGHVDQV